jgi:sulfhydrogenase subunit beta (sulfur reductase)
MYIVEHGDFDALIGALKKRGYTTIGPVVRDSAILYDEISGAADLPAGEHDEQNPAHYRLKKEGDKAYFGHTVGPHSWKKFLFPSILKIGSARRGPKGFEMLPPAKNGGGKFAFIGVRPCDIAALLITDKIFMNGPYADPHYRALREETFVVAVNCSQAGGTCFCTSMNTGPKAASGYDLALTEIVNGPTRCFAVEEGSPLGAELMKGVPHHAATAKDKDAAAKVIENTVAQVTKTLETSELKANLEKHYDHHQWEEVAKRCLSCTNCTMVCPTCFCTTIEDVTDLAGTEAERIRKWDSCFTIDFSYIHGGSVRVSAKSRYRQWMMHKLARWVDQFGTFGCVGCGRCITWCPVGIDITEEARIIQNHTLHDHGNI